MRTKDGARRDPLVRALWHMYELGARAAAAHASSYDATTTHDHRLEDSILYKMNLLRRAPLRNDRRIRHPDAAWASGFGAALADIAERPGSDRAAVVAVARDAGLTLAELRQLGMLAHRVAILRRAGVASGDSPAGRLRRRRPARSARKSS